MPVRTARGSQAPPFPHSFEEVIAIVAEKIEECTKEAVTDLETVLRILTREFDSLSSFMLDDHLCERMRLQERDRALKYLKVQTQVFRQREKFGAARMNHRNRSFRAYEALHDNLEEAQATGRSWGDLCKDTSFKKKIYKSFQKALWHYNQFRAVSKAHKEWEVARGPALAKQNGSKAG